MNDPYKLTTTSGGFGYLSFFKILHFNKSIEIVNGYADSGSGFYIQPIGYVTITIENTLFQNIHSSLNSSTFGYGGALYFDLL